MEANKKTSYKYCIVPKCKNTTIKTPNKLFFNVPREANARQQWCNVMKRDKYKNEKLAVNSRLYCCEDHFNIQEDMENYFRYRIMGHVDIAKLKPGVTPRLFECQRLEPSTSIIRTGALKRRIELVQEATKDVEIPGTSSQEEPLFELLRAPEVIKPKVSKCMHANLKLRKPSVRSKATQLENDMENYMRWKLTGGIKIMKKTVVPHRFDCQNGRKRPITSALGNAVLKQTKKLLIEEKPFASIAEIKECVVPENKSVLHQSQCGQEKDVESFFTSKQTQTSVAILCTRCAPQNMSTTETIAIQKQDSKLAVEHTTRIVNLNPTHYIGLNKTCMFVIDLIGQYTDLDTTSIFLTLQKICLAQKFCELGDAYGMSEEDAKRTFLRSVFLVSKLMKEFIIWPAKEKILALLPKPFKACYSNARCIIDCFEIEIQKPTDAVHQASTWSDYNKANTLKYLVSSTPDGLVNFMSNSFGGSTSDALIIEKSGFLDRLQPGTVIMTDRGFKHIENLLIPKQCTLWSPSSESQKLEKTKIVESKQIANLKIHIDRVNRRIREFNFLKPHSCVSTKLIPYMDFIMAIACGLINLQGPMAL